MRYGNKAEVPDVFDRRIEDTQLHKGGNINKIRPTKINFYRHEGGRTYVPEHCLWSTSRTDTTYDSSKLQRAYDENHTHLHIWLAANSHASYNRFSKVLNYEVHLRTEQANKTEEFFIEAVDYLPNEHDLYFSYDTLSNMGEVEFNNLAHGLFWIYHATPQGTLSKKWLGYQYLLGDDFFSKTIDLIIIQSTVWRIILSRQLRSMERETPSLEPAELKALRGRV